MAQQLPFIKDRYQRGNPLALYDGLVACEAADLPLPVWLTEALKAHLVKSYTGAFKGSRGRSNHPFKREIEKMKTLVRQSAVFAVRKWIETGDKVWLLHQPYHKRAIALHDAGDLRVVGKLRDDAYFGAQLILEGTFASADAKTIQRACDEATTDLTVGAFYETQIAFGLCDSADPPEKS